MISLSLSCADIVAAKAQSSRVNSFFFIIKSRFKLWGLWGQNYEKIVKIKPFYDLKNRKSDAP